MASLDKIRRSTRNEVEGALAGLRTKRADLEARLREVNEEISLGEAWLGRNGNSTAKPRTLQDAMALVLREDGNRGMRPARLAELIAERDLYRMKDGGRVSANGIQARVTNYNHLFDREDGLIRLKDAQA